MAVLEERICGFATVSVGSLERQQLPRGGARQRLPAYLLPVLRLARMGVASPVQRRGLGAELPEYVFRLALVQRDTLGCVGVVTDAKPAAVPFYERLSFSLLDGAREGRLHGGPLPMFLGIEVISAAVPNEFSR